MNVDYTRISAVDGQVLTPDKLKSVKAPLFSGYYKELTQGEIGCYLSHVKCWQHIVEQKLDYAVILEDDFSLHDDLNNVHGYIEAIEVNWDCIKLMEHPEKRKAIKTIPCLDKTLIRYDKIPSRTCAYVITNDGAQKMLKHSQQISRPIDIDFQHWWESNIIVYGLKPYIVGVNHADTSTIDSQNNRKKIRKSFVKQYLQMVSFNINNKKNLQRLED